MNALYFMFILFILVLICIICFCIKESTEVNNNTDDEYDRKIEEKYAQYLKRKKTKNIDEYYAYIIGKKPAQITQPNRIIIYDRTIYEKYAQYLKRKKTKNFEAFKQQIKIEDK